MKNSSWYSLEAKCRLLNMSVFAKWRPSTEVKAELADLTDEATAINGLADSQESGLDDTQQARWDELMGDGGLVAQKQSELDSIEAVETQKKELALARRRSSIDALGDLDGNDEPAKVPATPSSVGSLKAFKGPNAKQDAHDAGMWMRALASRANGRRDDEAEAVASRRGWGFQATMTEGTDSAGGVTVPDPVSSAFVEFRESVGIARQVCHIEDMAAETKKVPKKTAGPTVQYPGEATAATATDETWGSYPLTAVERVILSKVSNPLQADSLINFIDNVISRFGYEFALQEDNELINGDGTATYGGETGLLTALGAGGKLAAVADWGAVALSTITDLMGLLPSKHGVAPGFICSSNFYYSVMLKLLAAAGGNTIGSIEGGPNGMPSFLGKPVWLTDWMPTATGANTSLLYGTYSRGATIGDRSQLEVATSEHAFFAERVTGILGVSRYDIAVHEPGTASVAGAYVGLTVTA